MKKLITKFISLVLTLSVVMNVLVILPVSATEETEELITNFSGVPLNVKASLYNDDGLKYKYNFIYRNVSGQYTAYFINDITNVTDTQNIDNISYFAFYTYYQTGMYTSDNATTFQTYWKIFFDENGVYIGNSGGGSANISGYNDFYGYSSATDKIQNAVDNIIYSDFDVKYNDLTVYQTSNNKAVSIADIIELGAGDGTGEIVGPQQVAPMPGEYDFIGPLPLIKEEGNATFEGFKQWLIENEKYKELAQFGITCTVNNVSSLVDFWTGNYNSITDFYNALKTLFGNLNAGTQVKNIWNWLQNQWEEYKNSLITWETYPQIIPDGVTDIETDEDGNFISSELQYLKLILGVLMSAPQNTANFIYNNLNSVLTSISNNVYRIANYITNIPTEIYNNFVEPINLILEAINNLEVGNTTINNYDYSDDEKQEYEDLLALYKPKYTDLINSKFPFVSQLESIFNEIWVACGYTGELQTTTLTATYNSVESPQQTQTDYFNSQMSQAFPGYDTGYLNSVDTSKAPTYSINVGGTSVNIIDFRVFEKYRTLIHGLITLVLWIPFLYSLYRSIPSIIANVGDYMNMSLQADINAYKHEMQDAKFIDIPVGMEPQRGTRIYNLKNNVTGNPIDGDYYNG